MHRSPSFVRYHVAVSPLAGRLALLLLLVCGLLLPGCTGRRPLVDVREDAQWHEQYGRYDQALADYQEYVDRDKTDLQARLDLSRLLSHYERYREAAVHMEVAYSLAPQREHVVEQYAQTLFLADYHDTLLTRLRERAEARQTVDEYLRLAEWADRVGDTDQTRRALLTAERLGEGARIEPYVELAKLAARTGDTQAEVLRLKQALYIDLHDGDDRTDPDVAARLRAHGLVPGPTIALPPR